MQTTLFGGVSGRLAAALLVSAGLLLTACRKNTPEPPPPRTQIAQDLPRIPGATLLDTAGTTEAERWTFIVVQRFDSARAFFRDTLPRLGWTIAADNENRARETLDLYAHKAPLNLWIHLQGQLWEFGIRRTMYTVIAAAGGARDSTAPVRPLQPPARP